MQVTDKQGCDQRTTANHLTAGINHLSVLWFGLTKVGHRLVPWWPVWIRKSLSNRHTQNEPQMAIFCANEHILESFYIMN